jgi:hypothetical protein
VIGWRDWSPSDLLNRWGEEFKEFRSSGFRSDIEGVYRTDVAPTEPFLNPAAAELGPKHWSISQHGRIICAIPEYSIVF